MKNKSNSTAKELLCVALLLATTFLATVKVSAADGDLDLTFDGDGKVTTDFNASDDTGFATAIQADGKIVVAGVQVVNANTRFAVARYNTNGSLDTTFDGDGKVTTPIGFFALARAVAIQSDGKIVVVGTANSGVNDSNFAVVRYNANGTLDTAFGSTGIIITRFLIGIDESANAVTIQSDGKLVVAGEASNINFFSSFAIARYNANGSLDNTFDGDGQLTTTFAVEAGAKSVSIQSDGKITAAGTGNLARYLSNGALDSAFGTGGRVLINNLGINASKIQPDGNIVVAGTTVVNGVSNFGLARLSPVGFFDSTFGTGGRVATNFGTLDNGAALILQTDGKIIIAGRSVVNGQTSDFALARYNSNGSLDTSFGTGGKVTTDIFASDEATGAALQPDGKVVLVGKAQDSSNANNFAVVRYQSGAPIAPRPHQFDFDGDGRDDPAVFRPSERNWYIQRSTSGFLAFQFGLATDKLTPADYDGDGKSDIAVWREAAQSTFFVFQSATNTVRTDNFGITGDLPSVVGDWDGDGKADPAVYRNGANAGEQSFFFYRGSLNNPNGNITFVPWGTSGDKAVRGDFDGDGKIDPAVFRPSNRVWFVRRSSDNSLQAVNWGLATDKLMPGDYDGDGKTDFAVFRPSETVWYILQSSNNQPRFQQWGLATDLLVPGDYDGDNKTDIAVFRPSSGLWFVIRSTDGGANIFQWGISTDIVVQ